MRILYFYQYFSTSEGSWGTRVHDFASEWVKNGHHVVVITSIYSKSDLKAKKFIDDQLIDGIHVKVINILIDNKQSFFKRIWSFVQYALISSWYALTIPADVVIASSGPITVGLPGLIARYVRKQKLVFETRDLWPEGAIELGIIKNPIFKKFAYWFEKKCYEASELIVALSPGMKQYIQKNHHHPNVISITNAADIALFSKPFPFPVKYRFLKPYKYAIYTGNIGPVNNSLWLYESACELKRRGRSDIIILLIGDGQQKEELKRRAEEEKTENFILLELMPKKEIVALLQHALVSIVPLKSSQFLDTSSPNKFFEALAAGVPVIQTTNGWIKDFLQLHHVGYTVDSKTTNALVDKLVEMESQPGIRDEIKSRAMKIAATEFDKNVLAKKMLDAIEKII